MCDKNATMHRNNAEWPVTRWNKNDVLPVNLMNLKVKIS